MTRKRSSPPDLRRGFSPVEGAVLGLFFLSGASALVYEVVWTRDLTNVFGASAFAIATVLAAFMAGLALGSTLFGRVIDRGGNPILVYAVLEGGIAAWALVVPVVFGLIDRLYAGIFHGLQIDFYTLSLFRFVLSFLVLLVPATLMGGTLPVLGKFLFTRWERLGERAGLLYAANTLGAVVGTAAAGFFLLPALGLRGTTLVAAAGNVAVAALALLLSRRGTLPLEPAKAVGTPPGLAGGAPPAADRLPSPALARAVLWAYAGSGFAALAYEVSWTKTLSSILGTTTYAFTSMLVTFLLGLSLGSLLASRLADRVRRPEILLAATQIGIPLLTLGTIPMMEQLPQWFVNGFARFKDRWFALELYRILLAGGTMFLPTLLMGATFPLATRVYLGPDRTGTRLGRLYAANTVGAIFGSLVAGFLLIPAIGRQHAIFIAAMVNVTAAFLLVAAVRREGLPGRARWALGTLILLLVPAAVLGLRPWNAKLIASGTYVYAAKMRKGETALESMRGQSLLFYKEAAEATVSVWSSEHITSLRINGKIDASSHGDMLTQKMLSHLPMLYHRGEPERAFVLGLGSGVSSGVLLRYPLKNVDTAELIPVMPGAARFFDRYNYRCLDDPRHRLIVNDGRNYLFLTDAGYDVLVSEPTNPWIAGVGSLFTREYFHLTRERLRPGGIAAQWVQTYQYQEADLRTVLATCLDAYTDVHLWSGVPGDFIVVASMEPLQLDVDRVRWAISGPPGEDLASLEILPLAQILSLFVTDREGIEAYVGDWKERVTDDNLYLEYAVPRHMFRKEGRVDVTTLDPVARSVVPHLIGSGIDSTLAADVERYRRARRIALHARLRAELPPGVPNQEAAFRLALRDAPGEQTASDYLSHDVNEDALNALAAGDTVAALRGFAEAAAMGSRQERALALNNLGMIAFHDGNLDSAARIWRTAHEDEPDLPAVLYNLAAIASHEGRRRDAVAYYRRVVTRQSENSAALNNLAYQLALLGEDLAEAERHARRAVALDPEPNSWDTLGFVLVKRGHWDEAKEILSGIVARNPRAWESFYHLALAQAGEGDADGARASLQRVLEGTGNASLIELARDALRKL